MTDEEITYATVRFLKSSSGLQNEGKSNETQGPKKAGHKEGSVPWHLIAIPLGILCSILLVALAVLVAHIFQCKQEKHELQKTLNNIDQEYRTMKTYYYLRKEMLRNKSIECDALKDHLNSLERKQNRCYGEGKHFKGHWFCCGIKCYYFIMDPKQWEKCNQTCQKFCTSLLKIDDDDELDSARQYLREECFP
uniref:killer cell lectin-like receptor 2 isoform X2 n=1 Tax=Myodes glareolus TaxID=447135 RepID=UPI002021CB15|nr:killer cell lectin-like receptor 2 isoform X2 [Myodes glareolus]